MRTLKRNKKPSLHYANAIGIVEKTTTDKNGQIKKTGEKELVYDTPVEFKANIAYSGGNAEAVEFGLNLSDYQAIIVADKGLLPIKENSLIWDGTEPEIDDNGHAIKKSADYIVLKPRPTLNEDKFILKRLV